MNVYVEIYRYETSMDSKELSSLIKDTINDQSASILFFFYIVSDPYIAV